MSKLMAKRGIQFHETTLLRGAISCAIDSNNSFYTFVSSMGVSCIFLPSIQLDYQ
jgi:hypothetical protein